MWSWPASGLLQGSTVNFLSNFLPINGGPASKSKWILTTCEKLSSQQKPEGCQGSKKSVCEYVAKKLGGHFIYIFIITIYLRCMIIYHLLSSITNYILLISLLLFYHILFIFSLPDPTSKTPVVPVISTPSIPRE